MEKLVKKASEDYQEASGKLRGGACTFLSPITLWCGFWSTFRRILPLTI